MCIIDSDQSRATVPLLRRLMKKIANMTTDSATLTHKRARIHSLGRERDTNLFCVCAVCACSANQWSVCILHTHTISTHTNLLSFGRNECEENQISIFGKWQYSAGMQRRRHRKLKLDKNGVACARPFLERNENRSIHTLELASRSNPAAASLFVSHSHLYLSVLIRSMKLCGTSAYRELESSDAAQSGMRLGRQLYTWFGRLHLFHHLSINWAQPHWLGAEARHCLAVAPPMGCVAVSVCVCLRQLCRSVKIHLTFLHCSLFSLCGARTAWIKWENCVIVSE